MMACRFVGCQAMSSAVRNWPYFDTPSRIACGMGGMPSIFVLAGAGAGLSCARPYAGIAIARIAQAKCRMFNLLRAL